MSEDTSPEGPPPRAPGEVTGEGAGQVERAPDAAPSRSGAVQAARTTARAPRRRDAKPASARASRTLAEAREAFAAVIARDTAGLDRARLVEVLDALIAWSDARPAQLTFRSDDQRADVLAFELAGTRLVFWSAQAVRSAGPRLEITPPAGLPRTVEDRATTLRTLNAHSRDVLVEGDRLRIGFGALKNQTARATVLELMAELLANIGQPATPPPPAPPPSTADETGPPDVP